MNHEENNNIIDEQSSIPMPSISSVEMPIPSQVEINETSNITDTNTSTTSVSDLDLEDYIAYRKKKRFFILFIFILLLGVVGYIGYQYISHSKEEAKKEKSPISEENFVLGKEDPSQEYIFDADYSSLIDFDKNAGGCPISKASLKIPYINLNNEIAKEINSELKSLYEQAIGKYRVNSTLDQAHCTDVQTAYKSYENEKILSVVVAYAIKNGETLANPDFYVYNISTETGELIKTYDEIKNLSNQSKLNLDEISNLVKTSMIQEYSSKADDLYTIDTIQSKVSKTTNLPASTWKEYLANLTLENYKAQVQEQKVKSYLAEDGNLGLILTNYFPGNMEKLDKMITLK